MLFLLYEACFEKNRTFMLNTPQYSLLCIVILCCAQLFSPQGQLSLRFLSPQYFVWVISPGNYLPDNSPFWYSSRDKCPWSFVLDKHPWIMCPWTTNLLTIAPYETPFWTFAFLNLAFRQFLLDNSPWTFAAMKFSRGQFPARHSPLNNAPIKFPQDNWPFYSPFCDFLCFVKFFECETFRKMQ